MAVTGHRSEPAAARPIRDKRRGCARVGDHDSRGPALLVSHLSKQFGPRLAVDDVTFEVGRGEVFGFLGPNGAGKITIVARSEPS
jgi:ATPase subunit of ABC transporter with duplicated ATPase domains